MNTNPDYLFISIKLLGALGLLIYGMKVMSEALQKMAGSQLRHILGKMTTNRFTGMLTGVLVTSAVQSSSATTVMTVSFVNAGLLTLAQAVSVIMGANIGTTLTAWIMSLGYQVDLTSVVFPAFFFGMVLIYRRRHRYAGDFLFGIAFMFLSLVMLSSAGKEMDLEHNQSVVAFFSSFPTDSYLTIISFLLIGTVITGIVQSSAAVMALTILLCSTGVLPIHLGIALVMGENIGTTMTANLAALGASTQARRAAFAHLVFNVFGVVWVLLVFFPFVDMVCWMTGYDAESANDSTHLPVVLAMFHTCFNLANTLLLIGLIPQIVRLCERVIKSKAPQEEEVVRLKYIHAGLIETPEIALLQAQKETAHFALRIHRMFGMVRQLLEERDEKSFDAIFERIEKYENISDRMELEIASYLESVGKAHLSDETKMKVRSMMRQVSEIESIGDACYNIARHLNRRHSTGEHFTDAQTENLKAMMGLADDSLCQLEKVLNERKEELDISRTMEIEKSLNDLRNHLREQNVEDVNAHRYTYSVGSVYCDVVNECERLGDYVVNTVEARLGKEEK